MKKNTSNNIETRGAGSRIAPPNSNTKGSGSRSGLAPSTPPPPPPKK